VDGILLDLGVSSFQLDRSERGFSFRRKGPLDMRMDLSGPTTAAMLIHQLSAEKLERIFWDFGEERFSRKIAGAIVERRRREKIQTTTELADLIGSVVRRGSSRIHPATRVFQALRIAVNQELENLQKFLDFFPGCLTLDGRAALIAYHSLEDRLIKHRLREESQAGKFRLLNRRPIRPAEREIEANPRARSARLRIAERTG